MKDYLVAAIRELRPNSEFSYKDNDYSTIVWDVLEGEAPSLSEINATIKKLKKEDELAEENRLNKRNALLDKLGITEEEAQLLLS